MKSDLLEIIKRAVDEVSAEKKAILEHSALAYSYKTASPIEWAFMLAFVEQSEWRGCGDIREDADVSAVLNGDAEGTYIIPQAQIGNYRVDFLIAMSQNGAASRLVVECDGHDFHERTKEQAERDRSRDRALLSLGIPVMRFTGSEIYRSPIACASEAWDHIHREWFEAFTKGSKSQ